jgi:hypothetical protein
MLGRKGRDRRHGLAQLFGYYRSPVSNPEDGTSIQFYSYRSLLDFKLVSELPLPPMLGKLFVRTIREALVIIGIHHSDSHNEQKYIRWCPAALDSLPEFEFVYERSDMEKKRINNIEKVITRIARRLLLLPLKRIDPGYAASIHYAGTLPYSAEHGTTADDQVSGFKNVYVGDSSAWNYLPAKGLSFTVMANSVRVARHVASRLSR